MHWHRIYGIAIVVIILLMGTDIQAQVKDDSTSTKTNLRVRNPKKAALYSMIVPGGGQIYNRKYWKLPIVYGAVGTAVYLFFDNRKFYLQYREAYLNDLAVQAGEPGYVLSSFGEDGVTTAALRSAADESRQFMEYCVLGFAAVYALQIIDASVDAHLSSFDVSDNLSLQWNPTVNPGLNRELTAGVQLNFRF